MPTHQGVSHVALTVTDVGSSASWYQELFDAQSIFSTSQGGADLNILLIGDGTLLALRKHPGTDSDDSFTEVRVGLDHVGFACSSRDELESWLAKLDGMGARHSGIQESDFGLHLNLRDPDNIPLEFFVAATGG